MAESSHRPAKLDKIVSRERQALGPDIWRGGFQALGWISVFVFCSSRGRGYTGGGPPPLKSINHDEFLGQFASEY